MRLALTQTQFSVGVILNQTCEPRLCLLGRLRIETSGWFHFLFLNETTYLHLKGLDGTAAVSSAPAAEGEVRGGSQFATSSG